jgi:hypothetical protein
MEEKRNNQVNINTNPKVLLIAYYWPPAGGPGVQRWFHFVRHLPLFGITPVVYVPKNPQYPIVDETLTENLPKEVVIIKRSISEPYKWISWLFKKKTQQLSQGLIQENKPSLIERFMRFVRGNFFIPDARVSWVAPSVAFLSQYINEHCIETIISTGPPHSMHLIANELVKIHTRLKWIADFRDPWTTIGYHNDLYMTHWAQKKHLKLERTVLQSAHTILTTSYTTKALFSKKTATPIEVITNGFEPFENSSLTSPEENKFSLVHIGSLLSKRNPKILWEAIGELVTENQLFAAQLSIDFVGLVSDEVKATITAHGLASYCNFHGYISHEEARKHQYTAHLLLLIEIDSEAHKGIIPGKIFEYLQSLRPILAIGPKDWDVARLLPENNLNALGTYHDKAMVKSFIETRFNAGKGISAEIDPTLSKYERKNLTEALSKIIKNLKRS